MSPLTLFIIFFLVSLTTAFNTSDDEPIVHTRIIGGERVQPTELPYQVAVIHPIYNIDCGGTIIAPEWVMTAAHCWTSEQQPTSPGISFEGYTVVVGSVNWKEPKFPPVNIVKTVLHRGYHNSRKPNDIALLKLSAPVIHPPFAMAAQLPNPGESFVGQEAIVSGYGRVDEAERFAPPHLLKVYEVVKPDNECRSFHGNLYVNRIMLCARDARQEIKKSCRGDSGGPIAIKRGGNNVVIGINSYSHESCTHPSSYDVFTQVSAYIDWIKDNMR